MTQLRLPLRDRQMSTLLLAIMLLADLAAAATGRAWAMWPAFLVMPVTLLLMWGCYNWSLTLTARSRTTLEAQQATTLFMGRTLSFTGSVITVGHLGLIGIAAGWLDGLNGDAFLRLFMTALSVSLIVMHNRMPKMLMSHVPASLGRWYLRASWLGVLSGVVMIAMALTLPLGGMTFPFLAVAMTPTFAYLGTAVAWGIQQRKDR